MLLVAAEYPFRKIVGIEFAAGIERPGGEEHSRVPQHQTEMLEIESLRMDALDFRFPDGNLVLYFFNPFGSATMQRLLEGWSTRWIEIRAMCWW
jgi:hypothetical protein